MVANAEVREHLENSIEISYLLTGMILTSSGFRLAGNFAELYLQVKKII